LTHSAAAVATLRSVLFNVVFYGATFVLTIGAGLPLALLAPRRMLGLARLWARLILLALRATCGIRVHVTGLERIPRAGPALIAAQHQSAFDTLVWLALLPRCCYVLKQELMRIPVFGRCLRLAGMIAIDRSARASALRRLLRDGTRAAAEGRQIVIFPEGTRAPAGTVLPLQPGVAALARATGLTVVPAVTDSGRCWGRQAFRKRAGIIRVAVLPALPNGLPREQLMMELGTAVARGARELHEPVDIIVDPPSRALMSDSRIER
jgi:1-acyl-sn-glycerol-3-phosphate acyltransferase